MLTAEENERLTRSGPNTPMGKLFRQYWVPVALSEELVAGGSPVALTILGEELVAFRGNAGQVGLLGRYCPHRGVSLAYGRNEAGGLRCIYHGWKVAPNGRILEIPNARTSEKFRESLCQLAYPVQDAGGLIWAYFGDAAEAPAFPDWPWRHLPENQCRPVKVHLACNFLQGLEGGVDTSHINFLHRTDIRLESVDVDPDLMITDSPYGFHYSGVRDGPTSDTQLLRTTHFVFPSYVFIPPPRGGIQMQQMAIPIDDLSHWFFGIRYCVEGPWEEDYRAQFQLDEQFHPRRSRANHHLQDRERMSAGHWSGIDGVRSQDIAVVESARTIVDRTREHLVSADQAVTHMRRRMMEAIRQVERGGDAPGTRDFQGYSRLQGEEQVVARSNGTG